MVWVATTWDYFLFLVIASRSSPWSCEVARSTQNRSKMTCFSLGKWTYIVVLTVDGHFIQKKSNVYNLVHIWFLYHLFHLSQLIRLTPYSKHWSNLCNDWVWLECFFFIFSRPDVAQDGMFLLQIFTNKNGVFFGRTNQEPGKKKQQSSHPFKGTEMLHP